VSHSLSYINAEPWSDASSGSLQLVDHGQLWRSMCQPVRCCS
jgi:hypothetical protein